MSIVSVPGFRHLLWLLAGVALAWLLTGCGVDKHRDDNPFITPNGYNDSQPYG